jgi:hypothetical protein
MRAFVDTLVNSEVAPRVVTRAIIRRFVNNAQQW